MQQKPKVAIYWLGACAGCDEAIVDLNEEILKLTEAIDIVLWPVAMDFKYDHLRSMQDREIALSILSGSVRNSDHREMAELLRNKSQLVFALGTCACFGGSGDTDSIGFASRPGRRSQHIGYEWMRSHSLLAPHRNPMRRFFNARRRAASARCSLPAG